MLKVGLTNNEQGTFLNLPDIPDKVLPTVTVVTPTYNRHDNLVLEDKIKNFKSMKALCKHLEKKYNILDGDIINIYNLDDTFVYKLKRESIYKNYNDFIMYDILYQRIEFKKEYN